MRFRATTVKFLVLVTIFSMLFSMQGIALPAVSAAEKENVVASDDNEMLLTQGVRGVYNLDFDDNTKLRFVSEVTLRADSKVSFLLSGKKGSANANNKIAGDFGITNPGAFSVREGFARFYFEDGHRYKVIIDYDLSTYIHSVSVWDLTTGTEKLTHSQTGTQYKTTMTSVTSMTVKPGDDMTKDTACTFHYAKAAYVTEEDEGEPTPTPTPSPKPIDPSDDNTVTIKEDTSQAQVGTAIYDNLGFGTENFMQFETELTIPEGAQPYLSWKGTNASGNNKNQVFLDFNKTKSGSVNILETKNSIAYTAEHRFYIKVQYDVSGTNIYTTVIDLTEDKTLFNNVSTGFSALTTITQFSIQNSSDIAVTVYYRRASYVKRGESGDPADINLASYMTAMTYNDANGTTLPYRIYVPKTYDAAQHYPLLLFLHGAQYRGSDNLSQISSAAGILQRVIADSKLKENCIIVVPQCGEGRQWVDTPFDSGIYSMENTPETPELEAVENLLGELMGTYSIDADRLYAGGLSMGAYGTWDIAARNPELFAAIIPAAGGADPTMAEALKCLPIWTFHNPGDEIVPYTGTTAMVSALSELGGNITYTEYPDAGHGAWVKAWQEDELLTWLFSKSRSNMENHMTGKVFTASNNLQLPYRLYEPKNYDEGRKYSVLLYLHGAGEVGNDNLKHIQTNTDLLKRVVNDSEASQEYIMIAPQCPMGNLWVDTPYADGSYSLDQTPKSTRTQAVEELLEYICTVLPADRSRIYIAGISMGGYGTWDLIVRNPGLFAAAVPVCGAGDPTKAELIKHMPIWTFYGENDKVVPISGTTDMIAALKDVDEKFKYTPYANVGHNSWENAFAEPELLDWLSAQQQHGGSVQYQDNTLAVTQFSSEDETVSVIVAWFNDAGDLIDVELSADVKLEVGKPKTMNVNGSENKGKNVKIFVWNNLINMQAKCGTISGTEGNAIREYGIPWIAPSPKK